MIGFGVSSKTSRLSSDFSSRICLSATFVFPSVSPQILYVSQKSRAVQKTFSFTQAGWKGQETKGGSVEGKGLVSLGNFDLLLASFSLSFSLSGHFFRESNRTSTQRIVRRCVGVKASFWREPLPLLPGLAFSLSFFLPQFPPLQNAINSASFQVIFGGLRFGWSRAPIIGAGEKKQTTIPLVSRCTFWIIE